MRIDSRQVFSGYVPARLFSGRDATEPRILCICAESGMGKTSLMDSILRSEVQRGAIVRRLSLDEPCLEPVSSRISRLAREVIKLREQDNVVVVGIDCIPADADDVVMREAKSVRKMAAAGCLVVLCMLPEARRLVDVLGEAHCVDGRDLLSLASFSDIDLEHSAELRRLTHGIPLLVKGISFGDGIDALPWAGDADARYTRNLGHLLQRHLRDTLTEEEISLRLSMILLGEGSFDDLCSVAHRVDDELLSWLQEEAPLFGVDLVAGTFEVAGVCEDELLGTSLGSLLSTLREWSDLTLRAASALCRQGRYVRAEAIVCGVDAREELGDLGLRWGMQFLLNGKIEFVSSALRYARELDLSADPMPSILRQALCELNGRADDLARGRRACLESAELSSRESHALACVKILGAQRDFLSRGQMRSDQGREGTADSACEALRKHHECSVLLFDGQFARVFDLLVNDESRLDPEDVGQSLLCIDFLIAESLLGERGIASERLDIVRAKSVIAGASPSRMGPYLARIEELLAVLEGSSAELPHAERLIARANSFGDKAAEAAFLLVASLADLRSGALSRALVRSQRAEEISGELTCAYMQDAAKLVGVIARIRLGESPHTRDKAVGEGALGELLAAVLSMSSGRTCRPIRFRELSRSSFPRELSWALVLLVYDAGEFSEVFKSLVPQAWIQVSKLASSSQEMDLLSELSGRAKRVSGACAQTLGVRETGGQGDAPRVRVCLLDEFSVEVDGELVAPSRLGCRRARDLLAFLAIARGHKASKRDALLAIWGDVDYVRGMQRLYECISTIRRALGVRERGINPIVSSRAEGTVAFDLSCVSCDVDDFVEEAVLSLGRDGSDLKSVAHACAARRLYGAGPAIVLDDLTGITRGRSLALRELFVGALAAGGEAALREGRPHLASRLAQDALAVDPKREDVYVCLVTSLSQMGRISEIEALRESYRRQTLKGGRRCSRSLESAFDEALREDDEEDAAGEEPPEANR